MGAEMARQDCDPGPMARLREVQGDSASLEVIAQRVAGGETLRAICAAWEIPHGATLAWLMDDDGRWAVYRRALVASGFAESDEALEIADAAAGETEGAAVAAAKLRVEIRRFRATKNASEYFGERVDLVHHRSLPSEAALLAQLDALISSQPALLDQLLERRARLAQPVNQEPST